MAVIDSFLMGLQSALTLEHLMYAFIGCVIGTLVGVLPGIGPVAGIAMLLPVTFGLPATGALVMLCAIYYGTIYGGTITAVLLNVPGESSSVITALEGHQMAKKGRAGAALSVAAISSCIGGCLAVVGIMLLAQPLTRLGLLFGPPEFFALILVAFALLIGLAGRSLIKGALAALFGLTLTLPGLDPMVGSARLTFGSQNMLDGFGLVPVLMGLFGLSEVLLNIEKRVLPNFKVPPLRELWPNREEAVRSIMPTLRGTVIGFIIGAVPGLGTTTAALMTYAAERKVSRFRASFGSGAIEGVAGPEAANNSAANAALLPLLTLGLPGSASIALMMGAFLINGITPGPFLFRDHPELVWTLIASLAVGNVILLILNLPLVGIWTKVLLIPYPVLFTFILVFATVGSFSINHSVFDVGVMMTFGFVGYVLRKLEFPLAPIALTLILGPQFEMSLRQSLVLSGEDFMILFRSVISTSLVAIAVLIVASASARPLLGRLRRARV